MKTILLSALLFLGCLPAFAQFPYSAVRWKISSSSYCPGVSACDSIETYSIPTVLSGLNGGNGWAGAYTDRLSVTGMQAGDDMESYSVAANLNGLNGNFSGYPWGGAYTDKCSTFGLMAFDNFSTYSTSANVNTLNADSGSTGADGCQYSGFTAAYVAR